MVKPKERHEIVLSTLQKTPSIPCLQASYEKKKKDKLTIKGWIILWGLDYEKLKMETKLCLQCKGQGHGLVLKKVELKRVLEVKLNFIWTTTKNKSFMFLLIDLLGENRTQKINQTLSQQFYDVKLSTFRFYSF